MKMAVWLFVCGDGEEGCKKESCWIGAQSTCRETSLFIL